MLRRLLKSQTSNAAISTSSTRVTNQWAPGLRKRTRATTPPKMAPPQPQRRVRPKPIGFGPGTTTRPSAPITSPPTTMLNRRKSTQPWCRRCLQDRRDFSLHPPPGLCRATHQGGPKRARRPRRSCAARSATPPGRSTGPSSTSRRFFGQSPCPLAGASEDLKMGAPPHPETHRKAVTRNRGTTGHPQSPAIMPRSCRAESLFSRQPPALLQGGRVGEKMGAAPPEPTHSGAASRAALRPAP